MFKPEDRTSPSLQEKQEHAQALQEDKTWDQKKKNKLQPTHRFVSSEYHSVEEACDMSI